MDHTVSHSCSRRCITGSWRIRTRKKEYGEGGFETDGQVHDCASESFDEREDARREDGKSWD